MEYHIEQTELEALSSEAAAEVDAFAAALRPEAFVQASTELAGLARQAAKALYDYGTQAAGGPKGSTAPAAAAPVAARGGLPGPLPELYVEGFDAEQIWLQLEAASVPALKRAQRLLKKIGPAPRLLAPETEEAVDGEDHLFLCGLGGGGGRQRPGDV